jgi:hypothetical protein
MRLFATIPCSRLGKLAFPNRGSSQERKALIRTSAIATMPGERRVNREAKMNDLARQLLTSEAKNPASSEELAYATERICRELLRYLSRILGRDGSLTLLRRSLKQAQNKFSLLRSVETDADGGLNGFSQSLQGQESATLEIAVAVIESLLAVLAGLVGEDLAKVFVEDALINPRDAEATNTGNKL